MADERTSDAVAHALDTLNASASELDGAFGDGHVFVVEYWQPGDSDTPWRVITADENGLQVEVTAKFADAKGVGVWLALARAIAMAGGRL